MLNKRKIFATTLITAGIISVHSLLVWPFQNTSDTSGISSISATVNYGLKILFQGTEKILKNEDGSDIFPIIYNGRVFLPVRSIANLLGVGVQWNDKTSSVLIGNESNPGGGKNVGVKMPNVSDEMNFPNYWINRTADVDKIILDENGINEFNKKIVSIKETKVYDLANYPNSVSKDALLKYIQELPFPEEDRYIGDKKVEKSYYDTLKKNINIEGVSSENIISYGIVVKRTDIRTLPTKDPSYSDPNDFEFDYFQETAISPCEPVLVLYKTVDNQWVFIQSKNYRGWVAANDIAIANTKSQWLEYNTDSRFIVVTGNKVRLGVNPYSPQISELEISMGCKLPLVATVDIPEKVDGMMSAGNYVVKLPIRNSDGNLQVKLALINVNEDVHTGFLPYTQQNIILQAFKMRGDRYGWGGQFNSRDCSSFVADIYKCFGLTLPRNTSEQEISAGKTISLTNLDVTNRKLSFTNLKVGATLFMKNHEMLYLGRVDGNEYIMQSVYSYGNPNKPTASGGLEKIVINSTVVSDLEIKKRNNGKTFLENLTTIKVLE